MIKRDYPTPELAPGETSRQWCERCADGIPADTLAEIMRQAESRRKRGSCRELWSYVGEVSGHGSGVSSAIVARWEAERPEKGEDA